ncbi:MAG: flagellar biosynthesis anti-sigma factor FlgM [Phycisphaerales bacterium]|nr:flagellar biosynthesis anti-sigma factor FlgM [Phycisphaerales bacterium]MCI0675636.1 flagellar biosynthesis anti-sigma factor FlgM [Phycisphaerales bacterium]
MFTSLLAGLNGRIGIAQFRSANQPMIARNPSKPPPAVEELPAANRISELAFPSDVRVDLVERVSAQIAAGTYITPDKIAIAADRLADDFSATQ